MTLFLLGGQTLPFLLLLLSPGLPGPAVTLAWIAALLAWLPRVISVPLFRQSPFGALFHPAGVLLLLIIQWQARWRQWAGRPQTWKGRAYPAGGAAVDAALVRTGRIVPVLLLGGVLMGGAAGIERLQAADRFTIQNPVEERCADFTLEDQHRRSHSITFPRARPLVLVMADREGAGQIDGWILELKGRYGERVDYIGVADVRAVPALMRGMVRGRFREQFSRPILLDWSGGIASGLSSSAKEANLVVLDASGAVLGRARGASDQPAVAKVREMIERALQVQGQ
jgi:hypothetical protein